MSNKNTVEKAAKKVPTKTAGKKKFNLVKVFMDMWAELKKVTWLSRKELIRQSIVVVVFVVIFSVVIGVMDWGLSALLRLVIGA